MMFLLLQPVLLLLLVLPFIFSRTSSFIKFMLSLPACPSLVQAPLAAIYLYLNLLYNMHRIFVFSVSLNFDNINFHRPVFRVPPLGYAAPGNLFVLGLISLPIFVSVTRACATRTGAAASVERRRREPAMAISPE